MSHPRWRLPALATSYGHLSIADFAAGLGVVQQTTQNCIEQVVVCLRHEDDVGVVRKILDHPHY
jgi:hypothetical protein